MSDLTTADIRPNNTAVGILRNSSEAINDGAIEVAKRDYRYLNDRWMCSLTEKTNIVGITTDSQLSSNVFTNRRRITSCSTAKQSSPVPLSPHVFAVNGAKDEMRNDDKTNMTVYRNDDNNYLFNSNVCTNHWAREQVGRTNKIQVPLLENDRSCWSTCQQYARPAMPVDESIPSSSLSRLDEYSTTDVSKTECFFDASASFDSFGDGENTSNTSPTTNTTFVSVRKARNSCPSSFDDYEQTICNDCEHIDDLVPTRMALSRRQSLPIRSPALPLIASCSASTSVRVLVDEPSHADDKNCPQLESFTPTLTTDKIVRKKSSTRRKKPLAPKPPSVKPALSGIDSPPNNCVMDGDVNDNGNNSVRK